MILHIQKIEFNAAQKLDFGGRERNKKQKLNIYIW